MNVHNEIISDIYESKKKPCGACCVEKGLVYLYRCQYHKIMGAKMKVFKLIRYRNKSEHHELISDSYYSQKLCGSYSIEKGPVDIYYCLSHKITRENQLVSKVLYINQQRSHVVLIVWKRVYSTFLSVYILKSQERNHSSVHNDHH